MAALGKAGAVGAQENWLSRFLTASCAWAKRAEVQIPSGGTRASSPSVTVNHGLTQGQNRAGTANSAAASARTSGIVTGFLPSDRAFLIPLYGAASQRS